jgi:hypothetical protein
LIGRSSSARSGEKVNKAATMKFPVALCPAATLHQKCFSYQISC